MMCVAWRHRWLLLVGVVVMTAVYLGGVIAPTPTLAATTTPAAAIAVVINFIIVSLVYISSRYPHAVLPYWAWMLFRTARGVDAHSDYNLPFHPLRLLSPIYGGPVMHSIHHCKATNDRNFGGYRFWDWLCGTALLEAHPEEADAGSKKGR
jgi:sterol desaturase/sphingolipid hydroxylase (fatty acid hydroxylase superfamily)